MARINTYSMDAEAVGRSATTPAIECDTICIMERPRPIRNNWSMQQCMTRVRQNSDCTKRCLRAKQIREQLEKLNGNWKLPEFGATGAIEPVIKGKSKYYRRVERAKINKWGNLRFIPRNLMITKAFLKGSGISALAKRFSIDHASIRKTVYKYCQVANPSVFNARSPKMRITTYLRLNKDFFLPNLVWEDENRVDK